MTPSEYFHELIEPTIAEFEAKPASVRHAYATCVFVYHFADVVAVHARGTPEENSGQEGARRASRNAVHLSFYSVHFSWPRFGTSLRYKVFSNGLPRSWNPR